MEVINGITVPPEPAPSINNATLAGVDVNNNGVRDDVERLIARQWPSNYSVGIQVAKQVQSVLIGSGSVDPAMQKIVFCAFINKQVDEYQLMGALLNTDARDAAYTKRVGFEKVERCD